MDDNAPRQDWFFLPVQHRQSANRLTDCDEAGIAAAAQTFIRTLDKAGA
jgi:hypothetical protein